MWVVDSLLRTSNCSCGVVEKFETPGSRTWATRPLLNDPNIAGVLGFDESNGARFLVMDYVEGQSLSSRLDAGALPDDETLEIARRIRLGPRVTMRCGN